MIHASTKQSLCMKTFSFPMLTRLYPEKTRVPLCRSRTYDDLPTTSSDALPLSYLTNRFHVAVRLFSNRSQMTSKCGKNKKVAHEAIAECVTDVLTTF